MPGEPKEDHVMKATPRTSRTSSASRGEHVPGSPVSPALVDSFADALDAILRDERRAALVRNEPRES